MPLSEKLWEQGMTREEKNNPEVAAELARDSFPLFELLPRPFVPAISFPLSASAGAAAEGFNFRTGEKSNYPRILGFHPHSPLSSAASGFGRVSSFFPRTFSLFSFVCVRVCVYAGVLSRGFLVLLAEPELSFKQRARLPPWTRPRPPSIINVFIIIIYIFFFFI